MTSLTRAWKRASVTTFLALLLMVVSCCPPVILTDRLPAGRVDEPYYFALTAECWSGHWWVSGKLPPPSQLWTKFR